MTEGRVILVGAGPGEADLMTVRGRNRLAEADVVVHDNLIDRRLLDLARPDARRIDVGKRGGRPSPSQDEINCLLVDHARAGRCVVRLKGGDPFVFGRGGEEALALVEAGIDVEIVPGLTAGLVAPALAGIAATHRGVSGSVTLVTGHEDPTKPHPSVDWSALARTGGTLSIYMGVRTMPEICRRLVDEGMPESTPAAAVQWGGTPRQRTVVGTVASLAEDVRRAGLGSPAIVVVGAVVDLRQKLAWFEKRPLFGQRVIVTRPRGQADELVRMLERQGAEVSVLPTIRIERTDSRELVELLGRADRLDWIVLTSVHGVDAVFAALGQSGGDARRLAGVKLAAIGPATAEALAASGLRADLVPICHTTEAMADQLTQEANLRGKAVLLPRSSLAPPELADRLTEAGARVHSVEAYRTLAETSSAEPLREAIERGVDWVTFTSSSTARFFFDMVPVDSFRRSSVRAASIGPSTSDALRQIGMLVDVEADDHTAPGLARALVDHCRQHGRADTASVEPSAEDASE